MKLFGLPPKQVSRVHRQSVHFTYRRDGTVIVSKTPKGKKLARMAKITKQQVITWDSQLKCIGAATAEDTAFCRMLAARTGFYTRDLLIQAAYGHLVSWPGVGVAPRGVVETVLKRGKETLKNVLPHRLGNPQKCNVVTFWSAGNDGDNLRISVRTCLPSNPKVWLFHCDWRRIERAVSRPGRRSPHGKLIFFNCNPIEITNRVGAGSDWIFTIDSSHGRFDDGRWYAVTGELEDAAHFQWNQPPRHVPPAPPRLGFITYAGGFPFLCDRVLVPGRGNIPSFSMGVTHFEGDAIGGTCGPSVLAARTFRFTCTITLDVAGPAGHTPDGTVEMWLGDGARDALIEAMPQLDYVGYGTFTYSFEKTGLSSSFPPFPEFVVAPIVTNHVFVPGLTLTWDVRYALADYPAP